MKKRILSVILTVCFSLLCAAPALGAMSLSNFDRNRSYQNEFADVSPDAWYYEGIVSVYERGILNGKSEGIFDPAGSLTIAETIALAAKLHKGYYTGSMQFPNASPWYVPYLDYALENGIPAGAYRNMNAAATRSDFAVIIAGGLPDEALTALNRIADGAIPDVFESYSYGQAVYRLYRAGVLTGMDSDGAYYPGRTLTRAEAATLISRVVDASARVSFTLAAELTAEQIYRLASPSVFFIEIFDSHGTVIKTGSGFFISESGLAITNYHVIIGADSARITTDDGTVFDIAGMYDYNWRNDIALIQIDGEGFPYLDLADSSQIQTGATVYTLGSPLGLQASFTRGIVSQALREIEDTSFIQLDAPISSGSSGGALLDSSCRVIGITSATMNDSQNINLAVPINFCAELSREAFLPLNSSLISTPYYSDYIPAPDFGAYFNVRVFDTMPSRGGISFSYRLIDFTGDADSTISDYTHLVQQNLFDHTSYIFFGSDRFDVYHNSLYNVTLTIGREVVRGYDCFTVIVA